MSHNRIDIVDDHGMIDAFQLWYARFDARGDDDLIKVAIVQLRCCCAGIQLQVDIQHLDHTSVIA